jgi:hypothetical protein
MWSEPLTSSEKRGSPAWGIPDGARPLGSGQSDGSLLPNTVATRDVRSSFLRIGSGLAIAVRKEPRTGRRGSSLCWV